MAKQMGRPSLYSPKDGDKSYRILSLTKWGQRAFEAARQRLKRITKWSGQVSDADCVEFLLRGEKPPEK